MCALGLALVISTISPNQVRADDAEAAAETGHEEEAREAFERGRLLYDNGAFKKAAEAFDRAYALSGKPGLLYNVYIAHRDANQPAQAAEALRGYLEKVPDVENRAQLESRLAALDEGLERERQRQAEAEAAAAAAAAAASAEQEAAASPPPEAESAAPADNQRWWLTPTIVMAGGGALMAASIGTGIVSNNKAKDLESECTNGVCDPSAKSTRDTGHTMAVVTDVLLFSGAAVAITGAVLMVLKRPKETRESARLRPAVACGPRACGGSLTVKF